MKLVSKHSQQEKLVKDRFAIIFAAKNACMIQSEHRHFIGYDIYAFPFEKSVSALVQKFSKQNLDDEQCNTEASDVVQAGRTYVSLVNRKI